MLVFGTCGTILEGPNRKNLTKVSTASVSSLLCVPLPVVTILAKFLYKYQACL